MLLNVTGWQQCLIMWGDGGGSSSKVKVKLSLYFSEYHAMKTRLLVKDDMMKTHWSAASSKEG
jgi:hypothetical protein